MKLPTFFLSLLSVSQFALAAPTQQSYSAVDHDSEPARYLLGDWQVSPQLGFSAIRSKVGFNVGSHAAYQLTSQAPLFLEPSFFLGVFDDRAQFNLQAGVRYDIQLDETRVKPFARFALGPTFQTKESIAVFNAFAGFGAFIPLSSRQQARFEAGLVNVDGNAGFQMLAGAAF